MLKLPKTKDTHRIKPLLLRETALSRASPIGDGFQRGAIE
jgi:hypothetical protein